MPNLNSNAKKENSFQTFDRLKGKKILITAGPTIEKIDSVRLFHFSSGKMGLRLLILLLKLVQR
jgi:phosphopantothenoylcysteine synthetase/decarboxylase